MLGKGPTSGINGSFGSPEKKLDINFSKRNTIWVYIIIVIIVIFLLMEKKSLNLRLTIKMLTFPLNFVLKVFLMDSVLLSLIKYSQMFNDKE